VTAVAIAMHVLSAVGGGFGLWVVARSLRDVVRGARHGIRCHRLQCQRCGQPIDWADDDGCSWIDR
jgi:hypothetical protein